MKKLPGADTNDFLSPLRHLFPPPSMNSHAKPACSNTLTEAGYAHFNYENQSTVLLPVIFFNSTYTKYTLNLLCPLLFYFE